ncbi:LOW QUALITY PROTEIN: septin-7-like [Xenia sp. Carnegie-2017]|uniref:LOW QUALITY PROTEIN: septin-7-like n=1 Tax=Xenia sp. Carnegie-2017 TaxID=2897299 RepID=UPI001F04C273|nr:LOW QUALITY PROTEIN: septin-7-like [Xenia sp. Carnegie-2017]
MEATAKKLDSYVGFANLPNQIFRKSVKKGFEFSLMVVGESGLGKSTLLNSLFNGSLYAATFPSTEEKLAQTLEVQASTVILKEGGVNLRLTCIDTPGFGDAIDNTDCWKPIISFIESKFEEYLNEESRVNRTALVDSRVHCCLYFIAPNGHSLKPLDIEFMKRLHDKVNIVPIIAKADSLTAEECQNFKKKILNEIGSNKIGIYQFPELGVDDEDLKDVSMTDRIPFAVVGSNTVVEVGGKKLRARVYPWGVAEVENSDHCDFIALRNMLIRTHMQDLKDVTNDVHYENFRCKRLATVTVGSPTVTSRRSLGLSPLEQLEAERKERESKISKTESEMEQVFETKVKEKRKKLKEMEAEFTKKHEQSRLSNEVLQKEINEKRLRFEKDKENFQHNQNAVFLDGHNGHNSHGRSIDGHGKVDKKKKKGLF